MEWTEKAELFEKKATQREDLINKLEKKNEDLTRERDHQEDSLMKLGDQIYCLCSEKEVLKQKYNQLDSVRAEAEVSREECKS